MERDRQLQTEKLAELLSEFISNLSQTDTHTKDGQEVCIEHNYNSLIGEDDFTSKDE